MSAAAELRAKVMFILNKYNSGEETNYAENMLFSINECDKGTKNYTISHNSIILSERGNMVIWNLEHVLGECILKNDEDFFLPELPNI